MFRDDNFSQTSSVVILISLVALSLIFNFMIKRNPNIPSPINIIYPAYETENPHNDEHINNINKATPFKVNIKLPEGFEIKTDGTKENLPDTKLYCPYYIYSGGKQIGYVTFDTFTPPQKSVPKEEYHKYVWSQNLRENYEVVRTTDVFEAGICLITENGKTAQGILCYNKDLKSYVAFAFDTSEVDRQTAIRIALTLSFSAQ